MEAMFISIECLFYHFNSSSEKFECSTTFAKSSSEYILAPCKLKINDSNISYDDIKKVELKYDNQLIVGYDGYKSDLLSESIDSNEMFSDKKVRNIKKWQYEITYVLGNKTYIENLIINNN